MEIGSEFWKCDENLIYDNSKTWNIGKDNRFTLSGRTAIQYVLENIQKNKIVKKAYLPSYCCDSMIEPFESMGIKVEFYNVSYNENLNYDIDLEKDIDLFFAMNYFGYSETNMDSFIKEFKKKGKIVIEDITHSIFSDKRYSEYSDYLVGSLRKWLPITSGGIAVNLNNNFELDLKKETNYNMIAIKKMAMENKKNYIEKTENISKDLFLMQYHESDSVLDSDYENYSIDEESLKIIMGIDIKKIKNTRIQNVKTIYEKLKNNTNINFLVNSYDEKDVLLFVPIIIPKEKRDRLRKFLIDNEVYLPVHWPLEKGINNIYNRELSLVCDQRYNNLDISNYIDLIIEYFN